MTRQDIATAVSDRLRARAFEMREAFLAEPDGIRSCTLDDVLDTDVLHAVTEGLPPTGEMLRRSDYRERKFVTADLQRLTPSLRALITGLATQDVADAVSDIVGEKALTIDKDFYNGGLTAMQTHDFMVPHLDNSHNRTRDRQRKIVMLFYLARWSPSSGGSLALWAQKGRRKIKDIEYRRNRLVLLQTSETSWHSVEEITGPDPRTNITTYFYDPEPCSENVRLTRYAGRPGRPVEQLMAGADFAVRSMALGLGMDQFVKNRHAAKAPARAEERA